MKSKTKAQIAGVTGILLLFAFISHLLHLTQFQNILLIIATSIAGIPIIIKAIQSLKMKTFSIELLVSIAIIGAIFIGEYIESAVVSFLFLFGAYLETKTLEKTRGSLKDLIDLSPQVATVLRDGEKVVLPIAEVKKGDHVIIQSGERVAIDGIVVTGTAFVNEAAITGESIPAHKEIQNPVFSGSILGITAI